MGKPAHCGFSPLHHSTTPPLHHSTTPPLQYSIPPSRAAQEMSWDKLWSGRIFPHPFPQKSRCRGDMVRIDRTEMPSLEARYRRFMGILMNAEECLAAAGIAMGELLVYAVQEYERLRPTPGTSAPASYLPTVMEEQESPASMEQRLLLRTTELLQVIRKNQPDHPHLEVWLKDLVQWKRSSSRLNSSLSDPSSLNQNQEACLQELWSNLDRLSLPHEFVLPFSIFLAGLCLGRASDSKNQRPWTDPHSETLSRESLVRATEFALQEESQCLAKASSKIPGDTAFQCLFMGIAYVHENPTSDLDTWLHRGKSRRNRNRWLLDMGSQAVDQAQSRRLTKKIVPHLDRLIEGNFGTGVGKAIKEFTVLSI